jgi:hypothetical protein
VNRKLTAEQNQNNNLALVFRNRMFLDGESEARCTYEAQMLCATSAARRRHIEWTDVDELIEDLALEVKPRACLIIEMAKKGGADV